MLLSLANELKVLPTDLNRLLIIVVVLSMALTPFLAEAGKRFADSTVEDDADGAPSTCCLRCKPLDQLQLSIQAGIPRRNVLCLSQRRTSLSKSGGSIALTHGTHLITVCSSIQRM